MKYLTLKVVFALLLTIVGINNTEAKTDSIPQISDFVILSAQLQTTRVPETGGLFMFGYKRELNGYVNPRILVLVYVDSTGKNQIRRQAHLSGMPWGVPTITTSGTKVYILIPVLSDVYLAGNLFSFNVTNGRTSFSLLKEMRLLPAGRLSMIATKSKLYVLSNYSITSQGFTIIYHTRDLNYSSADHYCMVYCIDISGDKFSSSEVKTTFKKNGKPSSDPIEQAKFDILDIYPIGNSDSAVFRQIISKNDRIEYIYKVIYNNRVVDEFEDSNSTQLDMIPPVFKKSGTGIEMTKIYLPSEFDAVSWSINDLQIRTSNIALGKQGETIEQVNSVYTIRNFLDKVNYSNLSVKGIQFVIRDSANAMLLFQEKSICSILTQNDFSYTAPSPDQKVDLVKLYNSSCVQLRFMLFSSNAAFSKVKLNKNNSFSVSSALSATVQVTAAGYKILVMDDNRLSAFDITSAGVQQLENVHDLRYPGLYENKTAYFLRLGKSRDCRIIVNQVNPEMVMPELLLIYD